MKRLNIWMLLAGLSLVLTACGTASVENREETNGPLAAGMTETAITRTNSEKNIVTALLPNMLTAIIALVYLQTSLGSYWYTLETMYKDENGIQSAQRYFVRISRFLM